MISQFPRTALRRLLAGAVLCALGTPALILAAGDTAVADGGAIAVEPASGRTDWGNIRLVTDRQCPAEATNVLVEVVGANFPTGSFAVGNSELAEFMPGANGTGMVIPLFGSWDVVADANKAKGVLDGTAKLTLICIDQRAERKLGEMTGEVRFAKATNGASRYEQTEGPKLASGLALKAAANEQPYVYRYDLPAGSVGGPPVGGPTSASEAIADVNGVASEPVQQPRAAATTASAEALGETAVPDPAPGTVDDSVATAAEQSAGGTPTALIVGLVVMAAAGIGGYIAYDRARRQPPTHY